MTILEFLDVLNGEQMESWLENAGVSQELQQSFLDIMLEAPEGN